LDIWFETMLFFVYRSFEGMKREKVKYTNMDRFRFHTYFFQHCQ